MTICPIAIAVGCQKCPMFKVCPLKSVLGDSPKAAATKSLEVPLAKAGRKTAVKPAKKPATKAATPRKKSR